MQIIFNRNKAKNGIYSMDTLVNLNAECNNELQFRPLIINYNNIITYYWGWGQNAPSLELSGNTHTVYRHSWAAVLPPSQPLKVRENKIASAAP